MITTCEQALKWVGDIQFAEWSENESVFETAYAMNRNGQYWLVLVFDTKEVIQAIKAEAWFELAEQTAIRLRDVKPIDC